MKEKTPLYNVFEWEIYIFLKNYVTSEWAVSHNVVYNQQLSIDRYQVSLYGDNCFEWLPIVSSAFNVWTLNG